MKAAARQQWILEHLRAAFAATGQRAGVNTLDRDFVDAYVDATGAACEIRMVGSPYCRSLGADLRALYRDGMLDRFTAGIGDGLSGMGFPKWTWDYRLAANPPAKPMREVHRRLRAESRRRRREELDG